MKESIIVKQARLMLQILPIIGKEQVFALKGGTAINYFLKNMPRLSVDIDLVYLPLLEREKSLLEISQSLKRIAKNAKKMFHGVVITEKQSKFGHLTKLIMRQNEATVKIEPNLVLRGSVYPVEIRELVSAAQNTFELYIKLKTLSIADLYGGKFCAALDRQHPRDFFDIKVFFEDSKFTEATRKAFIVYLISHNRPMVELLNPRFLDFRNIFNNEFKGMTRIDISYEELIETRSNLVKIIKFSLTNEERQFIISIQKGIPEWSLLGLKVVKELPAVKWKLLNVNKMDSEKRKKQVIKLKKYFEL